MPDTVSPTLWSRQVAGIFRSVYGRLAAEGEDAEVVEQLTAGLFPRKAELGFSRSQVPPAGCAREVLTSEGSLQ